MILAFDNPAARHGLRLSGWRFWAAGGAVTAVTCLLAAYLLQRWWMEMPHYALAHPRSLSRWVTAAMVSASLVTAPWAAFRGALVLQRLQESGALKQYQSASMGAGRLLFGMATAALAPGSVTLALTLAAGLAAGLASGEPRLAEMLAGHLLLAVILGSAALFGIWMAPRLRWPALVGVLTLILIASGVAAVALLDPLYPSLGKPEPWIYLTLLVNPVTALGSALGADVLRFEWVYSRIRAHDYFYIYPPVWQSALIFAAPGGICFWLTRRRLEAGGAL